MIDRRDYYGETLDRIEPDIAMIDAGTYYASAAISLHRIANYIGFFRNAAIIAFFVWVISGLVSHYKWW